MMVLFETETGRSNCYVF